MATTDNQPENQPVIVPAETFERLLDFFARWHSSTNDPRVVGRTIKYGEQVWDEFLALADEQGFIHSTDDLDE
jgi:hypothetical protein